MKQYELYTGSEIIVDYKSQNNQDIIDYFEENSNFEGYAALGNIDIEKGLFTIKDFPLAFLSTEYLIAMNMNTNEYEYFSKDGGTV